MAFLVCLLFRESIGVAITKSFVIFVRNFFVSSEWYFQALDLLYYSYHHGTYVMCDNWNELVTMRSSCSTRSVVATTRCLLSLAFFPSEIALIECDSSFLIYTISYVLPVLDGCTFTSKVVGCISKEILMLIIRLCYTVSL